MSAANASIAAVAPTSAVVGADTAAGLEIVPRGDGRRPGLERFIADAFLHAYDARIEHFADHLLGLRRPDGNWTAGVGYTAAGCAPLFIEQYLDCTVEDAIADRLGVRVARSQIVEVGNLAAASPGGARRLIIRMTGLLHRLGHTWVVFTSTRALLNSFARLDVPLMTLAPADPGRLEGGAAQWGSYYDAEPQVMAGSVAIGFIHLLSRRTDVRSQ